MGIFSRIIFGHEVGVYIPDYNDESIEDSLVYEEADQRERIQRTQEEVYLPEEGEYYGKYYPPKERVWWRLW